MHVPSNPETASPAVSNINRVRRATILALMIGLVLVVGATVTKKDGVQGRVAITSSNVAKDTIPSAPTTVETIDSANYDTLVNHVLQKGCPKLVRSQVNIWFEYPDTVKCSVDAVAKTFTLVARKQNRNGVNLLEVVVDKTAGTRIIKSKNFNTANQFVSDDSATINHHTTSVQAAWKDQAVVSTSLNTSPWVWGNAKSCPNEIGFERDGSVTIYPAFPITCYAHMTTQGNFMVGLMNLDRSQDTMEIVMNPGYAGNGGIQCARVSVPSDGVVSTATNPNTYLNGLNGGGTISGLPGSVRCSYTDIRFYYG